MVLARRTLVLGLAVALLLIDISAGPASHAQTDPAPSNGPTADPGGPYSGNAGQGVRFDGSASSDPDGQIVSYQWDFGDGATSSELKPYHVYAGSGTYEVSLTVVDDAGLTATASTLAEIGPSLDLFQVSANHRMLEHIDGSPFYPNAETAWSIAWELNRNEVVEYFSTRKDQGFNTILMAALVHFGGGEAVSVMGDPAFEVVGGKIDPSRPVVTPGSDPDDPEQYDYWDHLDFVLDSAAAHGLFVVLLPTWGNHVAGSWNGRDTEEIVFDVANAYTYGRWIGDRYGLRTHLAWSLGGDRSAVYSSDKDYRPVWRAMAEGLSDGVNGENVQDGVSDYTTTLVTYHPRKTHPNSSG